jgi:hypothetical protein
MRRLIPIFAAVVIAQVTPGRVSAQAAPIERVAWLTGCWTQTNGTVLIEENWMAARGSVMLGVGRTTRGDTLREFEFTRIFMAGDTLVYGALPSGQGYTEFRASVATGDEVVFENPKHDFPQRVGYQRVGADSLIGFIEGQRGGKTVRHSFPYARVSCDHARLPKKP